MTTAPASLTPALTIGQEGIWLHERVHPGDPAYHLPFPLEISGTLDSARLEAAVRALTRRHPVLGARVRDTLDGPRWSLAEPAAIPITEHAVTGDPLRELSRFLHQPFDLARGPLARVHVLRGERSLLLFVIHHLAFDGASLPILLSDLASAYRSELCEAPDLRWTDRAEQERVMLAGPRGETLRAFWRDHLRDAPTQLALPRSFPGRDAPGYHVVRSRIDDDLRLALRGLARRASATLVTVLLGAFVELLRRCTGQRELLVGVPYQGIRTPDIADCIGYFNTLLPLRVRVEPHASTLELVGAVRAVLASGAAHGEYPHAYVVRDQGASGGGPLVPVAFVPWRVYGSRELDVRAVPLGDDCVLRLLDVAQEEEFPLTLHVRLERDEVTLLWKTRGGAVAPEVLAELPHHFERLLRALVDQPERPVQSLPLLAEDGRRQLAEWGQLTGARDAPHELALGRQLELQAARSPARPALWFDGQALTFRELDSAANRLARHLRALGVAGEVPVGLFLHRAPELVIAMFAVLKAGATFVPVDPAYPEERIRLLAEDSGFTLALTQRALATRLPASVRTLVLDEPEAPWRSEGAQALPEEVPLTARGWVLYTSGSTGRPKGVQIEQRGAAALLAAAAREFTAEDRAAVVASSSVSFDVGGFELLFPLCRGGSVVLARHVLDLLEPDGPRGTMISMVPSALRTLLERGFDFAGVRVALLAGEPLSQELVRELASRAPWLRIYDAYGPTETTIFSTLAQRRADGLETIGRPVGATRAVVLDPDGNLAPMGVVGELLLGGPGVSRGYLGQPELTAERFGPLPSPLADDTRWYRTGDLARWLPDGSLAFCGRRDHQLKLRGQRVELEEIEACLRACPGCVEAGVVVVGSGAEARLLAFAVGSSRDATLVERLRARAAQHLPAYMVPAHLEVLESLPRTPNGKLDRRALAARPIAARAPEPPATASERALAALWGELLGAPVLERHTDFFAAGGHSLAAVRLFARVAQELDVELPWRVLLQHRTLAALARALDEAKPLRGGASAAAAAPSEPGAEWAPLSPAQRGVWSYERLYPGTPTYHVPCEVELHGPLDPERLGRALRTLAERQAALRLVVRQGPQGPEQRVSPSEPTRLERLELEDASDGAALEAACAAFARRPFTLDGQALARFALVRLGPDRHRLLATFHHLVIDGPSLALWHRELWDHYERDRAAPAGVTGTWRPTPELDPQEQEQALQYHAARLRGAPAGPWPATAGVLTAGFLRQTLAPELGAAIDALATRTRSTRFVVTLAALAAALARATGRDDLVIGVAASHRRSADDRIGYFVHPLPLRLQLAGDPTLADCVEALRDPTLEALAHSATTLDQLAERLRREGEPAALPLQVMLVMVDLDDEVRRSGELQILPLATRSVSAKYPLTVYVRPGRRAWQVELEYDAERFEPAQLEALLHAWGELLHAPTRRLSGAPAELLLRAPARALPGPRLVDAGAAWLVPATPHQERLTFIEQFEDGTVYDGPPPYHTLGCVVALAQVVERSALRDALERLSHRHPALRATLRWHGATLMQQIAKHPGPADELLDESAPTAPPLGGGALTAPPLDAWASWFRAPMRVAQGPLVRVSWRRSAAGGTELALAAHRAILDRAALRRLAHELRAELAGATATAPPTPAEALAPTPPSARSLAYWRWVLRGRLPALELPEQQPRAAIHTFAPGQLEVALPVDAMAALRAATGLPAESLLLAAFVAVLGWHSSQREVVLGLVDARRAEPLAALDNLLVLRAHLQAQSFRALAHALADQVQEGRRHGDVPFDTLVRALDPEKDMSRTALFDVLFEHVAAAPPWLEETATGHGKYDLFLQVHDGEQRLHGRLVFNARIYQAAWARRLLEHLCAALRAGAADPDCSLERLELMPDAERRRLLEQWNDTQASWEPTDTLPALFLRRAAQQPASTALLWEGRRMSYRELARRAERWAQAIAERGGGRGELVAVMLERSFDLVAAILGVLRAGAAYLPIDPRTPDRRLAFLLEDAAPRLLIAEPARAAPAGFSGHTLDRDALGAHAGELPEGPAAEDVAYCIYTSGTTGRPKGALVTHRNVVRLLHNDRSPFGFGPGDVWTLFHSTCFDFSVWELFGALTFGGALVIVPEPIARDAERFWQLVLRERVTVLNQTPGAFYELARVATEAREASALRYVIFGGEKLQPSRLAPWRARHPDVALVNMYGITETTVHVTHHVLTDDDLTRELSPIGQPLPTTTVLLLDRATGTRLVPLGAVGELYVGGDGVCLGYLRRPELDAARFVPHPLLPGARLYRSGDLARYREDGCLEYLSRADQQVKLRGYRIEPAEIEAHLRALPQVHAAVVLLEERGGGRLVAYVQAAPGATLDPAALRAALAGQLPGYMVPAEYLAIDRVPLTLNGKVDVAALRAVSPRATPRDRVATSEAARRLGAIWSRLLELEAVDDHTSFFEAGGHSLLATQLMLEIERDLGVRLPLRAIFEHPRLGELARQVELARGAPVTTAAAADQELGPLSAFQERLWILERVTPDSPLYQVPLAWRLSQPIDARVMEEVLARLVERHELLRTAFVESEAGPRAQLLAPWRPALVRVRVDHGDALVAAREHLAAERRRPFALSSGQLLRAALLELGDGGQVLTLLTHHLLWDGGSLVPLLRFLEQTYREVGDAGPAGGLPPQYRLVVAAEQRARRSERHRRDLDWWVDELAGAPPGLALPAPATAGPDGLVALPLSRGSAAAVREAAAAHAATPTQLLAAVVAAVLHRFCGQDELLLGAVVSRRTSAELADVLGPCLDTVALRCRRAQGTTVLELLHQLRNALLAAQEHDHATFEQVVERLNPERRPGRTPLVSAVVTVEHQPAAAALRLGPAALQPLALELVDAKFDLTFSFVIGDSLRGELIYRGDVLDAADARALAALVAECLGAMPAAVRRPLAELELLSAAQLAWLRAHERGAAAATPELVPELVARAAQRTPEAPALEGRSERLSYRELDRRAWALAARLDALGGRPGAPIALLLPRGADLVIAMLASWRAGRPFCPLDPSYPLARVRFVLRDLTAAAVVVADGHGPALDAELDLPCLRVDTDAGSAAPRPRPTDPDALAYILYTSGSTGEPKGVAVQHRSLAHLVAWHRDAFAVTAADRASQLASVAFDAMLWETWPYLASGACVVPWQAGPLVPDELLAWLQRERITMAFVATPLAEEVWRAPAHAAVPLRWMLIGADRATRQPPSGLPYRVANNYGPTEHTVVATSQPMGAAGVPPATIGRPIAGSSAYVLDCDGRRCRPGVTGELYLGGAGVAQGYWRRPEQTAQRFLELTLEGGEPLRLYRTGDLARWRDDGSLEYLGRNDRQLQVRGRRVEPAEIEAALTADPDVAQATVHGFGDGAALLVAYAVPRGARRDGREVMRRLASHLPAHLMPDALVWLPQLPHTAHGKLDRAALPRPALADLRGGAASGDADEPQSELERKIAAQWCRVLGLARVGMHDTFFDVGGNSLTLVKLHRALQEHVASSLTVAELFQHPTVHRLARALERPPSADSDGLVERAQRRREALSPSRAVKREPRD